MSFKMQNKFKKFCTKENAKLKIELEIEKQKNKTKAKSRNLKNYCQTFFLLNLKVFFQVRSYDLMVIFIAIFVSLSN